MKLQAFLFSIVALPLYYQCNNNSQQKTQTNQEQAQTEEATQQSETDPSIAQAQTPLGDSDQNKSVANQTHSGKANKNPFGVMIAKTDNQQIPPAKQIPIAKALGVNYIRARITMADWNGSSNAYDQYAAAGLKIILNINYDIPRDAGGDKNPIPFNTDLQAYGKTLNSILDKYKPELVVIENEEDNPGYHSGTAQQYIAMLKTAIGICHSKGLKVTNAGITDRGMGLLVYDDYVRSGRQKEADDFAQRAFPRRLVDNIKTRYASDAQVKRQIEFSREVMQAYKTLDLDYVNFHWYEPAAARGAGPGVMSKVEHMDPSVFGAAVNYIKRVTGKPVITNEFGELNASPSLVQELMQKALDAGMDYAIWYSADGGVGKAVALQNGDGNLRPSGIAFRDFIKQHCR